MAVILTRCGQTARFVHQSDSAWPTPPDDLWTPAALGLEGATVFEVRALNSEQLAQATSGDETAAVGKVCAAGLVSVDGEAVDPADLAAGWQTDICTLVIEVSNGPLAGRPSLPGA